MEDVNYITDNWRMRCTRYRLLSILGIFSATFTVWLTLTIWWPSDLRTHNIDKAYFIKLRLTKSIAQQTDNSDLFSLKSQATVIPDDKARRTCAEQTNVIFVKVHKAGSSTVSNILQRFGSIRKLNFVLPKKNSHTLRYNYIGKPGETVSKNNVLPVPRGQQLNILCNHVIYNKTAFNDLFPPSRTYFYVSILRGPLQHFLSVIRYYGYSESSYIKNFLDTNTNNSLSKYLKSPENFEPLDPYLSFTNSRQSLDLGLPPKALGNISAIHEYVDSIRRDFDFVMLLEYFDESLIYLKRKLCWSFKDIIYNPKNGRWNRQRYSLSVMDLKRYKIWNGADYILYDKFHHDFWVKLQNEKEDFFGEVLHFKRLLEEVRLYCVSADAKGPLVIDASKWEGGFSFTNVDCLMMGLDELQFLDKIYLDNYGIRPLQQ